MINMPILPLGRFGRRWCEKECGRAGVAAWCGGGAPRRYDLLAEQLEPGRLEHMPGVASGGRESERRHAMSASLPCTAAIFKIHGSARAS